MLLHIKNHQYDQAFHRNLFKKFIVIFLNIHNHNYNVKIINTIYKIGIKEFGIMILSDIRNMHDNQMSAINVVLLDIMLGIVPVPISRKGSNHRWRCFQCFI